MLSDLPPIHCKICSMFIGLQGILLAALQFNKSASEFLCGFEKQTVNNVLFSFRTPVCISFTCPFTFSFCIASKLQVHTS